MKPIGNYIVITDSKEQVKTDSGILLSGQESDQLRYRKATVHAIGDDVKGVSPGDNIYYDKSRSFKLMISDDTYTIIREADVVIII